MKNLSIAILLAAAGAATAGDAQAHALLDHAVPAVGATVQGSPGELEIAFTENIVASFSGAKLASAEGAAVPTGKAVVHPEKPNVMHVAIGAKLKPGAYVVTWRAVAADTHATSGSYKFTVAP